MVFSVSGPVDVLLKADLRQGSSASRRTAVLCLAVLRLAVLLLTALRQELFCVSPFCV
jgi:hypothetical protein